MSENYYLASNVLCLILIVVGLHTKLELLKERILRVLIYRHVS